MYPVQEKPPQENVENANETLLNVLVEIKDYSLITIDASAQVLNWNEGAKHLYGYQDEEMQGKNVSAFYNCSKNESEQPWVSLLLAKENGKHEHEGWHYKKNGTRFYANTIFTTLYNEDKSVEGFVKITRDITPLKTVEEDHKKSILQLKDIAVQQKKELDIANKKLEAFRHASGDAGFQDIYKEKVNILDSIGDGFFAIDKNWNVTYWNTKAEILLNKKREDIIGKNLWETYPDAIDSKFYINYYKAASENITIQFEEFYSSMDMWVKVNVYPSPTGLSVYFQDITEHKKAECALRESEFRYRQIVETAQEGIWLVDKACNTTFVNQKMCDILEYTQAEMLGKPSIFFKDLEDQQKTLKHLEGGKEAVAEMYESSFITKSGKKIWTCISTNPMLDKDGLYNGALAMVTDITDKVNLRNKLLEDQLLSQHEITKAVVDAQERERAGIGAELHDNVNQLLATSRLYINICLSKHAYQKESLLKSQEYITEAIEELRKLSHALVGPTHDKIMGLIPSIEDLIFDISKAKKIEIKFEHSTFREERNDVGLKLVIYRIIQEQISNILKHANASEINIALKKEGKDLAVIIDDNGSGFDNTIPKNGIGLKNISNRAKLYDGTVQIISSPGNGCKMKIIFKNHGIGAGMNIKNPSL